MGKRLPGTPRSQVKAAIHRLWLRSRERSAALRRDNHTCQSCHRKASKAKGREFKVDVHHLNGIEWQNIIDYIYRHVLVDPKHLETLCPDCHSTEPSKLAEVCKIADEVGL
jgi:5-methylcytosine-specific restriction endonuclease McrA